MGMTIIRSYLHGKKPAENKPIAARKSHRKKITVIDFYKIFFSNW